MLRKKGPWALILGILFLAVCLDAADKLDVLIQNLLSSDEQAQTDAATTLVFMAQFQQFSKQDLPRILEAELQALKRPSAHVRVMAAITLGLLGNEKATSGLI